MNELIPPADPLGIPAPAWVFEFLYVLTFFLHIIFMNFILGGMLIILWNEWVNSKKPHVLTANKIALKVMPSALSFAITMGVAPLLFVQLLYGQFFYTSNIVMGFYWFSIFILVMIGFYLIYILISQRSKTNEPNFIVRIVSVIAWIIFLFVALLFTNNAVLTENPHYWEAIYTGQASWLAPDPALLPRYLHNVIGAVAVGGFWIAAIGLIQRNYHPERSETADFMYKQGLLWSLVATAIEIMVGFYYTMAIGMDRLKEFMQGGIWFYGWAASVVLALATLLLLMMAYMKPEKPRLLWVAGGHLAATLFGMSMGRYLLRKVSLADQFSVSELTVNPSYSSLVLFLVIFIMGLVVLAWLLRTAWNASTKS